MTIRNFYTIAPNEIQNGDVFICKLVAYVTEIDGELFYCLYRCQSDETEDSLPPQGNRVIDDGNHIASAVFSSLIFADAQERY